MYEKGIDCFTQSFGLRGRVSGHQTVCIGQLKRTSTGFKKVTFTCIDPAIVMVVIWVGDMTLFVMFAEWMPPLVEFWLVDKLGADPMML
jgi:hypothetical protein